MAKSTVRYAANGCPLKATWKGRAMYPAPVYVATFADGTVGRHSFSNKADSPIDFERGRSGACWLWRDRPDPGSMTAKYTHGDDIHYWNVPPRSDIIAGHVEIDGKSVPDPFFDRSNVTPLLAPKRQVNVSRILAGIADLDWSDIEKIQAAIDERLAA